LVVVLVVEEVAVTPKSRYLSVSFAVGSSSHPVFGKQGVDYVSEKPQ
jgi:hypothetical protein